MSQNLNIYIAYTRRRSNGDPVHWMIMYAAEGTTDRGTWIHVTGGPREGYTLQIQAGKRLDSFGIAEKTLIGNIKATDEKKLKDAAKTIPMQRCQRWTTAFVAKLEQKQLLPPGLSPQLESRIEPAPYDNQGKNGNAKGKPSGSSGSASQSKKETSSSTGSTRASHTTTNSGRRT